MLYCMGNVFKCIFILGVLFFKHCVCTVYYTLVQFVKCHILEITSAASQILFHTISHI